MATTFTTRACLFCRKASTLTLSDQEAAALSAGAPVQDVLPHLSPEQRELAISGTHPACWPGTPTDDDDAEDGDAATLDRVTRDVEAAGFGALIAGTSGGGCPIAVAGPMLAAHWAQIAWHDANEEPGTAFERKAAHELAIAAWADEADGAGNFPEAMRKSATAWSLEADAVAHLDRY